MIARPPLAVPLFALGGFVILLGLVLAGWTPLVDFDTSISHAFRDYGHRNPDLIAVLRVATDAAATLPFLLGGVVAASVLIARGQRAAGVCCLLVTAVVPVLWSLQHWLLHRPRPLDGFVTATSNGFPSGHTSNAAAIALVVVLLLWPRQARTGRVVTVVLAVGFALFIALTRLALLAHWPADVLGGWLLALVVVPLAARTATARTRFSGAPAGSAPGPESPPAPGCADRAW
ncbi:phosphatase PAP2 family protein [Micromonospora sp. NPDC003197]